MAIPATSGPTSSADATAAVSTANGSVTTASSNLTAAEQRLSTAREGLTTIQGNAASLDAAVTTAQGNLTTAEQAATAAVTAYNDANTQITQLRDAATQAGTAATDARTRATEANDRLTELQGQRAPLAESIASLTTAKQDADAAVIEADRVLADATAAVTPLETAYADAQAATQAARDALPGAQQAERDATTAYEQAQQATKDAAAKVTTMGDALAKATSDREAKASAIGPLEAKANDLESQAASAEKEAAAAEAAAAANPDDKGAQERARSARSRANSLRGQAGAAKAELERAREALRAAEQAERDAKAAHDAAKQAEADAKAAEEQARIAKENATKAREQAEQAVKDAEKAEEDAKKALDDAKKAVEDATKARDEAVKAAEEATKALEDATKELEELDKQIQEAQTAVDEANRAAEEAEKAKTDAEEALKTAEEQLKQLETAKNDAEKAAEDARKAVTDAEKAKADHDTQVKDAQARVDAAQQEVDAARTALESAQRGLEDAQNAERAAQEAEAAKKAEAEQPKPDEQAANLDNLTPEQRAKLEADQKALAEQEAAIKRGEGEQAQEEYDKQVKEIRATYFAADGHQVWIDADGKAYKASLDPNGNVQLVREEPVAATETTPAATATTDTTIRTDRSRTTSVAVESETPAPNGGPPVQQVYTETVHSNPAGQTTGSSRRIDQHATTPDGTKAHVSTEEDYRGDGTKAAATTESTTTKPNGEKTEVTDNTTFRPDGSADDHSYDSKKTLPNGAVSTESLDESFRPDGSRETTVKATTSKQPNGVETSNTTTSKYRTDDTLEHTDTDETSKTGNDTTKRRVETSYAANGAEPTLQTVVETQPNGAKTTADTRYENGVAANTYLVREGERAQGVPPTEYLEYDKNGKPVVRIGGGAGVDRDEFRKTLKLRRDDGTDKMYDASGPEIGDLSPDHYFMLDPSKPTGGRPPIEYTRQENDRFTGVTKPDLLAEPLEPSQSAPSAFEIPAALRNRATAANIDQTAPKPGTPEYDKLASEQQQHEAALAAAQNDDERARLNAEYYSTHEVYLWTPPGPDGQPGEPIPMASTYVEGMPTSDAFGNSRARQPHVSMARTDIQGTAPNGDATNTDIARRRYNDGSTDEVVHVESTGKGGAKSKSTTGEHYNSGGVLVERDAHSTQTKPRPEQGLEPVAITNVSRERFDPATGKPKGEQYYATATSDSKVTSLREQRDTFGDDGIIDKSSVDETTQSRTWNQGQADDFTTANEKAIDAARRDEFHLEEHKNVTVPPVGSFKSTKDQDTTYDDQGRPVHETSHEVNQSVQATTDENYDDKGNVTETRVDANGAKLTTVTVDRERGTAGGTTPIYDEWGAPTGDEKVKTNVHTVAFDPDDGTAGGDGRKDHQWREVTDVTTGSTLHKDGTTTVDYVTPYKVQVLQEGYDDDWGFEEKHLKTQAKGDSFEIVTDEDKKPVELKEGDSYVDANGVQHRFESDPGVQHSDLDFADDFESFMENYGSKIVLGATLVAGVALSFTGVGTAAGLALIGVSLALSSTQLAYTALNYSQDEASGWDVALDAVGVAGFAVAGLNGVRALSAAAKAGKGITAAGAAARGGSAGAAAAGSADDVARGSVSWASRARAGVNSRVSAYRTDPLKVFDTIENGADLYDATQAVQAAANGDWSQAAMFAGAIGANGVAGRAGAGWRGRHSFGANGTPDIPDAPATGVGGANGPGAASPGTTPGSASPTGAPTTGGGPATSTGAPTVQPAPTAGTPAPTTPVPGTSTGGGASTSVAGARGGPAPAAAGSSSVPDASAGQAGITPPPISGGATSPRADAAGRAADPEPVAFADGDKLDEHFTSHRREWAGDRAIVDADGTLVDISTREAYVARADHLLRDSAANPGDYLVGRADDGNVGIMNRHTGELVVLKPDGTLASLHRRGFEYSGKQRTLHPGNRAGTLSDATFTLDNIRRDREAEHRAPVNDVASAGKPTKQQIRRLEKSEAALRRIGYTDGPDGSLVPPTAAAWRAQQLDIYLRPQARDAAGISRSELESPWQRQDVTRDEGSYDAARAEHQFRESFGDGGGDADAAGAGGGGDGPAAPSASPAAAPVAGAGASTPWWQEHFRAPLESPVSNSAVRRTGIVASPDAIAATPGLLAGRDVTITGGDGRVWRAVNVGADGRVMLVGRPDGQSIETGSPSDTIEIRHVDPRALQPTTPIDLGELIASRQLSDPSYDGRADLDAAIRSNPDALNDLPLRVRRSERSVAEGRAAHNADDGWYVTSRSQAADGSPLFHVSKSYWFDSLSPAAQAKARERGYGPGQIVVQNKTLTIDQVIDANRARIEGDHGQLPIVRVFDGQNANRRIGDGRQIDPSNPSARDADQAVVHTQAALDYFYSRYGYRPTGSQFSLVINDPGTHRNATMQSGDHTILRIGSHDGISAAYDPGVIGHELGHKIVDDLTRGDSGATQAGAIHEGLADTFAAAWLNDPVIGRVFGEFGSSIRDIRTGANLIGTRPEWEGVAAADVHGGVQAHRGSGVVSGSTYRISEIEIGRNANGTPIKLGWDETGDLVFQALRSGGLSERMDFDAFSDSIRAAAAKRYGTADPRFAGVVRALDQAGLVNRPAAGTRVARVSSDGRIDTSWTVAGYTSDGRVQLAGSKNNLLIADPGTLLTNMGIGMRVDYNGILTFDMPLRGERSDGIPQRNDRYATGDGSAPAATSPDVAAAFSATGGATPVSSTQPGGNPWADRLRRLRRR